jgi:hypothetical protein
VWIERLISFLDREENKCDADVIWLQQAESKYHLELPGVVERAAGVLPEGRSCLRRDSIFVIENVDSGELGRG